MEANRVRQILLASLIVGTLLLAIFPVEPQMSTEVIFDDEVTQLRKADGIGTESSESLVLRITHDDGAGLMHPVSRVQELLSLEKEAISGENPDTAWHTDVMELNRIQSPFALWEEAFSSRNRSLIEAEGWSDLLQPLLEDGWCGKNATDEELFAFEATLLLLPNEADLGVACPSMPGQYAHQPPISNELLWMVWIGNNQSNTNWSELEVWADQLSESTNFTFEAVGVNMLFAKSKTLAEGELKGVMLPLAILLVSALCIGLRDPVIAVVTLGSAALVVGAEMGVMSMFGYTFSVIDGIAVPIIMGVAVDGAFWYCRSSHDVEKVRKMLFVAMLTTIAAVSLALFSPLRAQRSLALVMVIGIFLDWLITRYLLEDFYLSRKKDSVAVSSSRNVVSNPAFNVMWPALLLLLAGVAFVSPGGVEVLDINQFLPEDDPELTELRQMQDEYILASSTDAWILVNVKGDSVEDYRHLLAFQEQLKNHPSIISLDTGLSQTKLMIGIPESDEVNATLDQVLSTSSVDSLIVKDPRLQSDGATYAVVLVVYLDGQNTDAALAFNDDVRTLFSDMDVSGDIGGNLAVGAEAAHSFDESRMSQIFGAGIAVFFVAFFVLRSPEKALRIAVGTVVVGAAVDGMASLLGGRGVGSAPAVLLGMGFAADYLSHSSSSDHAPTSSDHAARWWAAFTSMCVFILIGFTTFPPSSETGRLLTLSIFFSVLLATALSLYQTQNDEEE
tara:strand:+ start:1259 stop:3451 length:2193 start_codon:yes stop_codon:yes gene_type:complete